MVAVLLIFTLIMTVVAALAKGVAAGKIDPRIMGKTAAMMTVIVIAAVFAALIMLFRKHKAHMKQSSSADILAEIMAMKDDNSKSEKEDEDV